MSCCHATFFMMVEQVMGDPEDYYHVERVCLECQELLHEEDFPGVHPAYNADNGEALFYLTEVCPALQW